MSMIEMNMVLHPYITLALAKIVKQLKYFWKMVPTLMKKQQWFYTLDKTNDENNKKLLVEHEEKIQHKSGSDNCAIQ